MGKTTGFMEYERLSRPEANPRERVRNFLDFHGKLPLSERQKQGARCMNCGVPFCQSEYGCPLHNLIPEWNDEVFGGNWQHALSRLLKTNNFPEFTGRVCPALCENACICGMEDAKEAVSVRDNELAVIEFAWEHGLMEPTPPVTRTGKKVAVVGSGPAGLAAADQLNKRGHSITVYERDIQPGGLLMYGIPNMKLDKAIVARRIEKMQQEGIEFQTGVDIGSYIPGEKLIKDFDAIILCCGARKARTVDTVNEKTRGVVQAMEYLTENTKALQMNRRPSITAKGIDVVIIGNGDTATDCVATAVRQGAVSVTQLVRKPKPAENTRIWPYKATRQRAEYGQEEAAAIYGADPRMYESTVKELITDEHGNLCSVLVNQAGKEVTIPAGMLILAAGFSGAEEKSAFAFGLTLNEKGRLGGPAHETANPKIFTAGDMRLGATLVVTAIAEGRLAAREADRFLEGYTNL